MLTHPSFSPTIPKSCKFNLLKLKPHCPACPSVLLKYTLPLFSAGLTYQLPHRSLATSGRSRDWATAETKSASRDIDRRRLSGEMCAFLRDVRSEERVGWVWFRIGEGGIGWWEGVVGVVMSFLIEIGVLNVGLTECPEMK